MITFLGFALLGLGAGGAYAIASVGLIQIYRGSGVLNLAHGAIAFTSAVIFVDTYTVHNWGFLPAAAVSIVGAAIIGALVEVLVMYPLRKAALLVRMIATLGVFAIIQVGIPLVFGTQFQYVVSKSFYPVGQLKLAAGLEISYDRLVVLGITVCIGVALAAIMRFTRFGIATTASAENSLVASTMGVNSRRIALANWVIGSMLGGLAGVLLVPIVGFVTAEPFLLLVIPALAAAMVGRFSSFSLAILGACLIGMGQSLLVEYQQTLFPSDVSSGWPDALPLIVIIVLLMRRGSPFPRRGEVVARLPKIGRQTVGPLTAAIVAIVAAGATLFTSSGLAGSISTTAGFMVIGMSLVLITGLAGQISLGQMAIAGVGALIAARMSHDLGAPFPLAATVAVVGGALVGLLFALPASRTRGPTLAIATLGVGVAIEDVVLANGWFTVGLGGTTIYAPSIFGLNIDGITHAPRYAAFCVLIAVFIAYLLANLRAGPTGRRLVAMRNSERAASSIGVSPSRTKTAAFVASAALASLGGVLLAFQNDTVTYDVFGAVQSLNVVVFTLIGGIGYILGPLVGALGAPSALINYAFTDLSSVQRWITITSGLLLIITLIFNQQGVVAAMRPKRKIRGSDRPLTGAAPPGARQHRDGATLEVRDLTVSYGGVVAVSDLSCTVQPGEIVGLVGPNGAGKTSAIDAISGFASATAGHIVLGGVELSAFPPHKRATAGMGRSFQTVEPFDDLTVAENLAVAAHRPRWTDWIVDAFRWRPATLDDVTAQEAGQLGLDDLRAMPDQLPQGNRRILGVLRALAAGPSVLLLDEPAAGLDRTESGHLVEVLQHIARERHIGLLIIEHDVDVITKLCDRIICLDFGVVIFEGTPSEAKLSPQVRAAYLGEPVEMAGEVAER
jgi:sulfate-transporting ATPase